MKALLLLLLLSFTFMACGQNKKAAELTTTEKNNSQTINNKSEIMDLSKISNETVKKAIEALGNNDLEAWNAFFTDDVVFTDDGNKLDFKSFFENAFQHKEKFLSIDKVENDGKDITGNFFAGQWGTFRVFFKFHQQADGKFNRLDIGQTK